MSRKSRWIRITTVGLLCVAVAGGAALYFLRKTPERLLNTGEKAYDRGARALDGGDGAAAAQALDEASLLATRALDELEEKGKGPKDQTDDAVNKRMALVARGLWLKARAMRDLAFARALADGKPLKETLDSSTGEMYRSVMAVPDGKARQEAFVCLRRAGFLLSGHPEVQKEALRAELSLPTRNWPVIERFTKNILLIDATDARSHLLLAQHEFEQPRAEARGQLAVPTPPDKRSRSRVLKAREHLDKAKEGGSYPVWRTLHLEAQLTRWLRDDYRAKRDAEQKLKAEEKALRELLDPQKGVAARAAADKGLDAANLFDVRGAAGLHQMALELALEDARRAGENAPRMWQEFAALLAFCQRLSDDKAPAPQAEETTALAVSAALLVQPMVTEPPPNDWDANRDAVEGLGRKARERKLARPSLYVGLARLLERESQRAGRRGDRERQEKWRGASRKWIEDGLSVGAAAKLSAAELAELHTAAAEKEAADPKSDPKDFQRHIDGLKESKLPHALGTAAFLEGVVAEREGRLGRARERLEEALRESLKQADGRAALPVRMALANVYLALGEPLRSLEQLGALERAYQAQVDKLPPDQRALADEFVAGPEALAYLGLVANLEAARQKVARHTRQNPGKPVPAALVSGHESAVQRLLKLLPARTPPGRSARQALAAYYARTGRAELARQEVAAAQKEQPDSLELLQHELRLLAPRGPNGLPDARGLEQADRRVERFVADYPRDHRARLFKATWLMRTGRVAEAVAYLEDPVNFPGVKDDAYRRVLAAALLAKGDRAEGLRVLGELPHDHPVDLFRVLAAGNIEEKKKEVQGALARYEHNALFRCLDAGLAASEGKYDKAAEGYFRALEFTQVRPVAEAGLWQTLHAMAQRDPAGAQKAAAEMIRERPAEKMPYLGYAYACLLLDDLGGRANETWARARNLTTALDEWERLATAEGHDAVSRPVVRAEFWAEAGRPDLAHKEILRALKLFPEHPSALTTAVRLATQSEDPALWERAREHLAALQKVRPGAAPLGMLARLEERAGRPAEAVKAYRQLLDKYPDQGGAVPHLARLLEQQGEREQAAAAIAQGRKKAPHDAGIARAEVRHLAAAGQLDRARQAARHFVDEQLRRVRQDLTGTKGPVGPEKLQEVLDRARDREELAMAQAFLLGGAADEAEAWLRPVLDRQPAWAAAPFLLAEVHRQRQAWQPSADAYRKVLEKDPRHYAAGNNLAWLLAERLGEPREAYRVAQEARRGRFSGRPVSGDRLDPRFLDTLGVIYHKLNDPEKLAEMREVFEAARRTRPADPRVCLHLGRAYAGQGDAVKAKETFAAAVTLAGPEAKTSLTPAERQEVIREARAAQEGLR